MIIINTLADLGLGNLSIALLYEQGPGQPDSDDYAFWNQKMTFVLAAVHAAHEK